MRFQSGDQVELYDTASMTWHGPFEIADVMVSYTVKGVGVFRAGSLRRVQSVGALQERDPQ